MTPRFLTVARRSRESADVFTLELDARGDDGEPGGFAPGQFNMLYAFGVGEVPISMSGPPAASGRLVHTIRAVGPVSSALTASKRGAEIGVRGPYGSAWPIAAASGLDVVVIAGGIGLAPLRPAIYELLRTRKQYGRVAVLYGARSPAELLFRRELDRWRRLPELQVRVSVDRGTPEWVGEVGVVTHLLPKIMFDPADSIALICGPEVMIRFTAMALEDLGVERERIFVSLERNMKCAVGTCGHCQFGPRFICKDGPIFRYDHVCASLGTREL
jgi:NAD(P)H-flavin reductase